MYLLARLHRPHDYLFFHYGSSSAVRHGRYKLYRRNGRSAWQLFDLQADIGETANQAARHAAMAQMLEERFQRWYQQAERERRSR